MFASNKDESEQLTQLIEDLSIKDDVSKNPLMRCAACGKEGDEDNMNNCNKCKAVKYCNAACKKKHKSKHKKPCERRVATLHDEALFKEPPHREECPICFLPQPLKAQESIFKTCCGKTICCGCNQEMLDEEKKRGKKGKQLTNICAFCRTPEARTDGEENKRLKNLIQSDISDAYYILGSYYERGGNGLPQNYQKANELYLKAAERGCADGYYNIGVAYDVGKGVDVDKGKAKHYWELAAMAGYVDARYNLGMMEGKAGNHLQAYKHFMISARAGDKDSLEIIKRGFIDKNVSKDEYEGTLRAYHARQVEMKSEARDKAATVLQLGHLLGL